jgi:hypothetical protein
MADTAAELDPHTWSMLYVNTLPADDGYEVAVLACPKGQEEDPSDWPVLTILRGYQQVRYAQAVITAAVQARHEQMIFQQFRGIFEFDRRMALQTMMELRESRPAISDTGTKPLSFRPIFGNATQRGLVIVSYEGTEFTQWEVDDAMSHGQGVLEGVAVAPLDTAYYRFLRDTIGAPEKVARAAVHGLAAERAQIEDAVNVENAVDAGPLDDGDMGAAEPAQDDA